MKIKSYLDKASKISKRLLIGIVAFLASLFIAGIIISLGGFSFVEIYSSIFEGSLGTSRGVVLTLATSTPLIFTGLGFAIGIKVGIINTGLEGQLYFGGIVAALVGAYIQLPPVIHAFVAMSAGAIAGGAIGALMGWFKVKFGAPEVITGIMLNSIIMHFTSYLSNGPLKPPRSSSPQTTAIMESSKLTKLVGRSQLTTAFLVAVFMCILIYLLYSKVVWGYQMMVVGMNPAAAQVAGINSARIYQTSLSLSGFMAGLAGGGLALGIFHRFIEQLSNGLGFQGIPVSALASHNPLGVIFSGLLFGALKAGSMLVNQNTSIPFEFVDVVQALVVIFIAVPELVTSPVSILIKKLRSMFIVRTEIS